VSSVIRPALASTDPIVEMLRAPRQGAGDGEGHGRIAVDTGRADAHALTDQLEQGSESLVEGHEGFKGAELFSRPGPRRLE
jgi:hypothetical protein